MVAGNYLCKNLIVLIVSCETVVSLRIDIHLEAIKELMLTGMALPILFVVMVLLLYFIIWTNSVALFLFQSLESTRRMLMLCEEVSFM